MEFEVSCRLQLKRGLFWYWHHPQMHEMVSDRSSRAEIWTDLRKMSMRVFSDSKRYKKIQMWVKQIQTCNSSWNKSLKSYTGHTKIGKHNLSDIIELNKTHIEMLRRSVQISARELRSETISCIFGWLSRFDRVIFFRLARWWATFIEHADMKIHPASLTASAPIMFK